MSRAVVRKAKGRVCQRGKPKASGMAPKRESKGAGAIPEKAAQRRARAWRRG